MAAAAAAARSSAAQKCLPPSPPPWQARYLRAILTSHARSDDLEAALAAVKEAKEEALQASRCWRGSRLPAQQPCPTAACRL